MKKAANATDHEPPQGYICYRCGEKAHWIQLCPTNDNPEYDNRPRVKRTTGIPKSFLKTVDKATALGQNADGDDAKTPSGVMVNADGEFVIAEPDKASWAQFKKDLGMPVVRLTRGRLSYSGLSLVGQSWIQWPFSPHR